jgi:hypothetical protein
MGKLGFSKPEAKEDKDFNLCSYCSVVALRAVEVVNKPYGCPKR